jgi:hypothetical protein
MKKSLVTGIASIALVSILVSCAPQSRRDNSPPAKSGVGTGNTDSLNKTTPQGDAATADNQLTLTTDAMKKSGVGIVKIGLETHKASGIMNFNLLIQDKGEAQIKITDSPRVVTLENPLAKAYLKLTDGGSALCNDGDTAASIINCKTIIIGKISTVNPAEPKAEPVAFEIVREVVDTSKMVATAVVVPDLKEATILATEGVTIDKASIDYVKYTVVTDAQAIKSRHQIEIELVSNSKEARQQKVLKGGKASTDGNSGAIIVIRGDLGKDQEGNVLTAKSSGNNQDALVVEADGTEGDAVVVTLPVIASGSTGAKEKILVINLKLQEKLFTPAKPVAPVVAAPVVATPVAPVVAQTVSGDVTAASPAVVNNKCEISIEGNKSVVESNSKDSIVFIREGTAEGDLTWSVNGTKQAVPDGRLSKSGKHAGYMFSNSNASGKTLEYEAVVKTANGDVTCTVKGTKETKLKVKIK